MNRKIRILLCSMIFGLSLTACLVLPGGSELPGKSRFSGKEHQETVRNVAWWSTMYERPNPDQLPVKVRFEWLKGLE